MENYEDDYYIEEKEFQDCKSNLFLSGKLGKVTEVEEKTINLLSNPNNCIILQYPTRCLEPFYL